MGIMEITSTQTRHCGIMLLLVVLAISGCVRAEEEESPSMSLSEVVEMIDPFGQNCDPKPERSQVEEMVLNKVDASHGSKCFRRCLLQQFDVMPEGKLQYDENKVVDMMNTMFPDKEDQSRSIAKKCNAMAHATDACESAHNIAMCMLKDMKEASYKIPEIKE